MTDAPDKEVMSWLDLGEGARALAEAIHDDGYSPDIVLAIARGGLLVAGAIAYALGVKNTFTMNVEFYTGIDERLPVPMLLPPVPDLVDFAETKVLIADDVADTGATLALVHRRPVREAALDRPVPVRLAAHRPLDRLPLERPRAGRRVAAAKRLGSPGAIPYSRAAGGRRTTVSRRGAQ